MHIKLWSTIESNLYIDIHGGPHTSLQTERSTPAQLVCIVANVKLQSYFSYFFLHVFLLFTYSATIRDEEEEEEEKKIFVAENGIYLRWVHDQLTPLNW